MFRAVIAALLVWSASTASALTVDELASQPECAALDGANENNDPELAERIAIARYACRLPIEDIDDHAAQAGLGDQSLFALRSGNTLTVFARTVDAQQPDLRGSLRGRLERIGDSPFAAARFRLTDLDRAHITISANGLSWSWRGPNAPARPERKAELNGRLFEQTLHSDALGETRRLQIYLPPGFSHRSNYAAVFIGDGQWLRAYARFVEPLIERGELPALVLVGALSGQDGIVEDRSDLGGDIRGLDYLPDYLGNTERFPDHMRFFSQELVAYAVREYGVTTDPHRRVVSGHSNAASLAFWAAYLHADVFGNAIVMSQAWRPVENIAQSSTRARFYMSAGLYEQPFLRTTRRTAAALRSQGYNVTLDETAGGHNDFTDIMFVDRVRRIFNHTPAPGE